MGTIAAWLATQGLSALLGVVVGFAKDMLTTYLNNQAQQERGRLQAERDQALEALRVQAELAEQASRRVSDDDVLARLAKGDA